MILSRLKCGTFKESLIERVQTSSHINLKKLIRDNFFLAHQKKPIPNEDGKNKISFEKEELHVFIS